MKDKKIEGQFVPLPRDLLASDAWRTISINGRRFIDFLMLEHLRHGGRQNGNLKAPQRQLYAAGVGPHHCSEAIAEVEERGLVEVYRYGQRVATEYGLTWLPTHDGSPASNQWRSYWHNQQRRRKLPAKQQAALPAKQQADGPNLPVKQQAGVGENLPAKQQALYRSSYQDGDKGKEEEGRVQSVGDGNCAAPALADAIAADDAPPVDPSRLCP